MLEVPEAPRRGLDRLDAAVEAFGRRVGDPVPEVGEQTVEMAFEHAGDLLDRAQPGADRPSVPALEVGFGKGLVAALPELAQHFLERPGPRGFQVTVTQGFEGFALFGMDTLFATQPEVARALQAAVTDLGQRLVLAPPHGVDRLAHMLGDVETVEDDLGFGEHPPG